MDGQLKTGANQSNSRQLLFRQRYFAQLNSLTRTFPVLAFMKVNARRLFGQRVDDI